MKLIKVICDVCNCEFDVEVDVDKDDVIKLDNTEMKELETISAFGESKDICQKCWDNL